MNKVNGAAFVNTRVQIVTVDQRRRAHDMSGEGVIFASIYFPGHSV